MGEKYILLGWARGTFETETKEKRAYVNIYVYSPVSTYTSEDYQAEGFKAEKKSCVSDQVLENLTVGEEVDLYFDSKGRVTMIASTGRCINPIAE